MIKLDDIFPIVNMGEETTAKIIGIYVYDENIYVPVIISSTDEFKVFQVFPQGIKAINGKIVEEFSKVIFAKKEVNKVFE